MSLTKTEIVTKETLESEISSAAAAHYHAKWARIHLGALWWGGDVEDYGDWLASEIETLDCEKCKGHAKEYALAYPVIQFVPKGLEQDSMRLALFSYTNEFHNSVNIRLGKDVVSLDDALVTWNGAALHSSKRCDQCNSPFSDDTIETNNEDEELDSSESLKNIRFDLSRFMGVWHQQVATPMPWQSGCLRSWATYTQFSDSVALSWRQVTRDNSGVLFSLKNACSLPNGQVFERSGIVKTGAGPLSFLVEFNDGLPSDGPSPYVVHYTDYESVALVGNRLQHNKEYSNNDDDDDSTGQKPTYFWVLVRPGVVLESSELDKLISLAGALGYSTENLNKQDSFW